MGGENIIRGRRVSTNTGSSPRGRGKLSIGVSFRVVLGLIPAWAGKTGTRAPRLPRGPAHPRVGGENYSYTTLVACVTGSSPRGRGKPISAKRDTYQERLIPAWAGKTCALPSIVRSHGGSSPRGRGKRGDVRRRSRCGGLIPAWAGKTRPTERTSNALEAHPRVGGENCCASLSNEPPTGSSPRGRGKRGRRGPG